MTHERQEQLNGIVEVLQAAKSVVILTGAGVSAESGIPTFRGAMEGHWSKYSPQELATPEAFARDPERVSRWYDERRLAALNCSPNPGHDALARLEKGLREQGATSTILTQNVDQLHQRSGSERVLEVHGSIVQWRCTKTGDVEVFKETTPFDVYPVPSPAGGLYRPNVIWFGEPLNEDVLSESLSLCKGCDVYMAIGTSAVVYPATGFITYAVDNGAKTIEINPSETSLSAEFDYSVRATSGSFLPDLVDALSF